VTRTLCILLVSDDDELRALVVGCLRNDRRVVLTARNAAEALSVLDVARVTAIVLDLAPGSTATQLLAARAERPDVAMIPVVIMAGEPPDPALVASPWIELIGKPVDVEELASAIDRVARTRAPVVPP
jgi:DNA-binding NtrC family response regulator